MSPQYPALLDELERGPPVELKALGGGCIAEAAAACFSDGSCVFVKRAAGAADMFPREAEGLRSLAAAGEIRVPQVLAVNENALVLEWVEQGPRPAGFSESFGRSLARLHQHRGKTSGFAHDNYIGSTPQINTPLIGEWNEASDDESSTWPQFFLQRRLRYQVSLMESREYGADIASLLDAAENRFAELLSADPGPPSLLHGDLWSGNYLVDDHGAACLIDPAVYYGHRESELAMTRLFGGFDQAFYGAYDEMMPLTAGFEERLPMYQLYHLLNHLNLFGRGYLSQCVRVLRAYG